MSRIAWTLELRGWFIFMGVCLLLPSMLQAQQPNCEPWITVPTWQGTVTLTGSGTITDSFGNTNTLQESDTIQLTFSGSNSNSNCPGATWLATGQSTNMNISVDVRGADALGCQQHMQKTNAHPVFPADAMVANITMDFIKGIYIMNVARSFPSVPWDVETNSDACGQLSPSVLDTFGPESQCVDLGASLIPPTALPSFGTLSGSVNFSCNSNVKPSITYVVGSAYSWTITWNFSLTPLNLDLLVTIPQYKAWRPSAGRNEKDLGFDPATGLGPLEIDAQLFDKNTNAVSTVIPDKVSFSLVDVSHEPGVAMNWPAMDKATSDPDMTFDPDLNILARVTNGSVAVIAPQDTSPATVFLSSHDWGGWATLNVIATVNGRQIPGHLQGDSTTDILLPKRQPGSHVADSWKTDPKRNIPLSTPDSDDSENSPKGDNQPGDGLTLWEEYRGFYMGCSDNSDPPQTEELPGATCQHAEGDPQTKDLFVVELTPADDGAILFAVGSGLKVHHFNLKLDEVGPKGPSYRVINFNHSVGAHYVEQHALVIQLGPTVGHSTGINIESFVCPTKPSCRPGLPKEVDHIEMDKDFTGTDPTSDRYATDVAHELSHAVDVYHHGDIDGKRVWAVDPTNGNIIEAQRSGGMTRFTTIFVKTEDEDPSVLRTTVPLSKLNLQVDAKGNPIPGRVVYVGNILCGAVSAPTVVMNGQHSGDVSSFMRYFSAEAYIPAGFPAVRFWVAHTDGKLGFTLTDHPEGTGVNLPGREPRVRYGNAYGGDGTPDSARGNDASQVDVNDKHDAIIRPDQVCP